MRFGGCYLAPNGNLSLSLSLVTSQVIIIPSNIINNNPIIIFEKALYNYLGDSSLSIHERKMQNLLLEFCGKSTLVINLKFLSIGGF